MSIRAIPTEYQGYSFRSRLEARWAVFFDHVGGIFQNWQYEPEGFVLPEGGWYLPDFWLPKVQVYVEVKPDTRDPHKWDKARELAFHGENQVLLLEGPPQAKPWVVVFRGDFGPAEIEATYLYWKEERFWWAPSEDEIEEVFEDEHIRRATQASRAFRPAKEAC